MGEHDVRETTSADEVRNFTRPILADLRVLEALLERSIIEDEIRRVGAEREMLLVEAECRPVDIAEVLLTDIGHGDFSSEIGRLVAIATERDFLLAAYGR